MPFKLKLKRSRHYSVVSKSLFVISVEILDGTIVECTLSSESAGQDCLDVVCQKLSLNQPKFFGLQYLSKSIENNLCWLELDRPIKRQLDKYARGLCVCLRVMYYVISGVRLFNDEVTRYHYFLQLKQDVIEGRMSCSPQQAVELASYSMQAEFGNFDAERHTAHYLKDFQLFPKTFTDPSLLENLTEAASRQHAALHNLPQGTAEEYYICACQRLDGYGQEVYSVKDHEGVDTLIGICLTGIYIGYPGGKEGRHYGWSDISNVINHKRDFTIETVGGTDKVEFQFTDADSAKNSWRFCVLQHIFYRQYEMNSLENDKGLPKPPIFQLNESWELLVLSKLQWNVSAVTGFDYIDQVIQRCSWGTENPLLRRHAHTLVSICYTEPNLIQTAPSVIAAACISSAVRGLKLLSTETAVKDICTMLNVDVKTIEFLVGVIDNAVAKATPATPEKMETQTTKTVQGYESPQYGQPETPTEVENIYI